MNPRVPRRRGLGVVEVLIGLVVLGLGAFPLFSLLRTTRGVVGQGREMLALELGAMRGLAEVEALVAAGHFRGLGPDEEEELARDEGPVALRMVVTRDDPRRLLRVAVRAESETRFFRLKVVVADPLASVHTWSPPPAAAPGHESEEGGHR